MSSTRIKRSKTPPRRPVRASAKRRRAGPSRANALLAALPVRPQTLQRIANWTVGICIALMLGFAAHLTGVTRKIGEEWADAVGRAGFQVRRVEVVGADRIDRLKVYDIALGQQNRSMAAVDLDAVRGDLLRYGWIKDARVSRRLPDTLVVDIVERTPAAIWQHNRRLSLIDESGVVLEPVTLATMPDLPLVIGPRANEQSRALDRLLSQARSLQDLLAGATWVGNRRWDLRFRSGEVLSLPEGEVEAKAALARFAHLDGANRLLGRGIVRFDMRDPKRFVLRLPPEGQVKAASAAAASGAQADAATTSDKASDRDQEG